MKPYYFIVLLILCLKKFQGFLVGLSAPLWLITRYTKQYKLATPNNTCDFSNDS